MSSANPKSHEPSMEEILASIRRIISDDQPKTEAAAPAIEARAEPKPAEAAPPAPLPIEDDILDLDDEAQPEATRRVEEEEIVFADPPPPEPPKPEPPREQPAPRHEPPRREIAMREPPREEALLSRQTDEAVSQAFQTLAGSILAGSQRTLDDIVAEMLRPMLKVWLDDNLPGIVERLVRAEIERVARGGR